MNSHKYFKSTELIVSPLCAIGSYKDGLTLSSGAITRNIKKLVLTGEEDFTIANARFRLVVPDYLRIVNILICVCSHYVCVPNGTSAGDAGENQITFLASSSTATYLYINDAAHDTIPGFKAWLAEEYQKGTPVTIWYVLNTSVSQQISVPSGLSGTVEGTMIQSGTPTPTSPIYPIANTAVGWYDIKNYVRNTTWQEDGSVHTRSGGSWSSSTKNRIRRSRKKK